MNELLIMIALGVNNYIAMPQTQITPIVEPVSTVQVQKWDLPECKPVEIEFTNDADRSA
jgi:hypothetical protein